jgi:hypothetical protein
MASKKTSQKTSKKTSKQASETTAGTKKARKKASTRKADPRTPYQKKVEQALRVGRTRDKAIARKNKFCGALKHVDQEVKSLQALERASIDNKIAAKKMKLAPSGVRGERNVLNAKGSIIITGTNAELQDWFANRFPGFNASIEDAVKRKRRRAVSLLEGATRAYTTASCAKMKRKNLATEIKNRRVRRA